jgi:hypothetical protein
MDIQIEPKEALTGFLDLPNIGRIRAERKEYYFAICLIKTEGDSMYNDGIRIDPAILSPRPCSL